MFSSLLTNFSPQNKEFRLYYSASSIHLNDSRIDEPLYLGLARAESAQGPWTRVSDHPLDMEGEVMMASEEVAMVALEGEVHKKFY